MPGAGAPSEWERDAVTRARVARLATVRPDGTPHLVPITFALEGDLLITAVDDKPKRSPYLQRVRNIEVNPAVSVLVDAYDEDWTRLWWVRVDGQASVQEPREALLRPLVAKYARYGERPPRGPVLVVSQLSWTSWSGSG